MRLRFTEILIGVLIALNLVDFIATFYALGYLSATEANPVLLNLIETTGTVWSVLWFTCLVLSPLVLYWLHPDVKKYLEQEFVTVILLALVLLYSIVNIYSVYNITNAIINNCI